MEDIYKKQKTGSIMNPHKGSSLRSLFEELGEWNEVEALAQKKIVAEMLRRGKDGITE